MSQIKIRIFMTQDWYQLSANEALNILKTSQEGLSEETAKKRLIENGRNEIGEKKRASFLWVFLRQFMNPLVLILILALAVKVYFHYFIDGIVLGSTIFLMAIIGFFQEVKAERAIDELKKLSSHKSKVKRESHLYVIDSALLVPGDIVYLEMGDKVPSDARIIEACNLKVDESMITGESCVSEKTADPIQKKVTLADQKNMVFAGTVVTLGRAVAVIVETGLKTEMGKIAKTLTDIKVEKTPLQKNIQSIGLRTVALIFLALIVFAFISYDRGFSLKDIFFLGVSAAVSAIPESLPAAFTITLATGMYRMAKKNAIIRKLIAVETLGSATVICSDKTGTLTLNQMTVVELASCERNIEFKDKRSYFETDSVFYNMLLASSMCNDASITINHSKQEVLGDPTEVAILRAAAELGIDKSFLEKTQERIKEIPFTSESRFMATMHLQDHHRNVFVKGAPEKVFSLCKYIQTEKGIVELNQDIQKDLNHRMLQMMDRSLRLIAVASCLTEDKEDHFDEGFLKNELVFLGILGLEDPPREEVKESIEKCHLAGIKVIMITGDNPKTAESVARHIGIQSQGVLTGTDLSSLSDHQLFEKLKTVAIFARIEPMQKLRIVHALKAHGQIIAMTGDGINDAPALEEANIGVAMGLKGTDVAKQVSDMVIADDHFDSIVSAIEEGRAVFSRLRNITGFLVTTCFGELLGLVLCVLFIGLAPMTPIQILWINLVTGSWIAIPMGLEPKNGLEMLNPPRDPKSKLIFKGMLFRICYLSTLLGLGSFIIFACVHVEDNRSYAQTMVLTSIVIFEWLIALHMRTDELPLRKIGTFKNRWLILAIISVFLMHLCIVYIPFLNPFFQTTPLKLKDWLIALIPGGSIFIIESLRKEFFPKMFSNSNGFKKAGF
jgi:P-type Ca2+ transporter type 2C